MDSFDLFEKVEGLFVGLLAFIRAFFVTLVDLAFRPRRFAAAFSESGGPYARPFSFLTISTFSIVTVLRNLVTLTLVTVITFMRGCSSVTQLPSKDVSFMDLLRLPSAETIIYVALPVVLLVVVIARFFDWAIVRPQPGSAGQVSSIFRYVVGFQFILIPLLVGAILLPLTYRKKGDLTDLFNSDALALLVLGPPVLAGVLWPCVSIIRMMGALHPHPMFRVERRWLRRLYGGLMCVACISATFASSIGVALVFARQDVRRIAPDGPLLTASFVEFAPGSAPSSAGGGRGPPVASVLIRNNADFELWLLGDGVILSAQMDQRSIKAHIANGRVRAGVIHLRPGESITIDVAIEGYGADPRYGARDGGMESNGPASLLFPFKMPGNENEMIIHFSSVNADGTLGEVNAVLLAEEGRRGALRKELADALATHP